MFSSSSKIVDEFLVYIRCNKLAPIGLSFIYDLRIFINSKYSLSIINLFTELSTIEFKKLIYSLKRKGRKPSIIADLLVKKYL